MKLEQDEIVNELSLNSLSARRHTGEISKLIGLTERAGYTIVPLKLYWVRGRAKLRIALAKGKKQHDKRETIKQREWDRQKRRILKHS